MISSSLPVAIYMEGALGLDIGKMGYGVLRYSQNPIVCVIDSCYSGKNVSDVVKAPRDAPVVGTVSEALALGAKVLILGTAPSGGLIPPDWFAVIDEAVNRGMSVVNGLHEKLAGRYDSLDAEQIIWDIRQEPTGLLPGTGAAASLTNRRVVMVGMDMAVGKMTAGLELYHAALRAGVDAGFVATGQIGITVTGRGVPLDAVRVDYATGAIEREVMYLRDKALVIVEGQGSLVHPGSTSTLPLLRGAMPTDLILCGRAGQTKLQEFDMPPIADMVKLYEQVATVGGTFPGAKVRAIAMNTAHCSDAERKDAIEKTQNETGLPVSDPVVDAGEGLFTALEIHS